MTKDLYASMVVCANGHILNRNVGDGDPDLEDNFCIRCGALVYSSCRTCGAGIRGERWQTDQDGEWWLPDPCGIPSYCSNCGAVFPWQQARIDEVKLIAEEADLLSEHDKDAIVEAAEGIAVNTASTERLALRFKRLARKAGDEAYAMFIKVATDLATEAAKKVIGI